MSNRLFVAIDLPESIRGLLADLDPHIRGMRWTDRTQMHLTLGFFGDVPENTDLKLREKLNAIQFGAFFLPVNGIGSFSARGTPKIVWIGVGKAHPHLFQIHKRVQEAALAVGLEPELRPWHPHVTSLTAGMSSHKAFGNSYDQMPSSMLEWSASIRSICIPAN
jgi:2'-5' RNA ligase